MKIKDVAHNHSLTDLLKVSIFSIVMLAPIISVGVRSAYVVVNKNAYQSYYGETINDKKLIDITNYDELESGQTYYFTSSNSETVNSGSKRLYIDNLQIISTNASQTIQNDLINAEAISTTWYGNVAYLVPYIDNTAKPALDMNSYNILMTFELLSETHSNVTYLQSWDNFLSKIEYNKYSYLDNVFEYSVNSLNDSQLFNWVTNTGIYTGINTMNTQLGINQPVIALLLSYWLLLTVIYIIIDIVIRVFTWLTHMIGSKTA